MTVKRSIIPEPYQTMVRRELRRIPAWKLQETYGRLKAGEPTGIETVERNRAYALSAIEDVLWERGKLPVGGSHSSGKDLETEEEWDQAFGNIVPLLGIGISAVSLTLGVMALRRGPLGRRAYYQDGQCLVSVRYPGQWHGLTEFITPADPEVQRVLLRTGYDTWRCLDFVCKSINYKREIGEMWQFPSETLARGLGDCEDTTFLFVSLAQNFAPDVWAILGDYQGFGHAWATKNGFIYETTYTEARQVVDPQHYRALVAFNHYEINEAYPGALRGMFALRRNEAAKLKAMAQVVG